MTGRTPNQLQRKKPNTSATLTAKVATSNAASVRVVMSASNSQPMTSLIAAALMAMTPIGVRVMSNSIMMRPSIGNAVIEKAVATNSADASTLVPGESIGALI